jgi:hypothetical protein
MGIALVDRLRSAGFTFEAHRSDENAVGHRPADAAERQAAAR